MTHLCNIQDIPFYGIALDTRVGMLTQVLELRIFLHKVCFTVQPGN